MESILLYGNQSYQNTPIDISIVIPTYKRTAYLTCALDSIFSQQSSGIVYEVIVINNNPEDDMEELIQKYRDAPIFFYSNKKNYGQVGNINQGVSKAAGKFVSFLHDDDMLMPNYFSEIRHYLYNDNISCLITSQYDMYADYRVDYKRGFVRALFFFRNLYKKDIREIHFTDCLYTLRDIYNPPTCGTLFRRKDLLDFGGFRDKKGAAWDFYNFREYNKKYRVFLLHKNLGVRRMFTGMSNNPQIVEDFRADERDLIAENQNNHFVRIFGKAYLNQKGMKYVYARVFRAIYLYSTNLDGTMNIKKSDFKKYSS